MNLSCPLLTRQPFLPYTYPFSCPDSDPPLPCHPSPSPLSPYPPMPSKPSRCKRKKKICLGGHVIWRTECAGPHGVQKSAMPCSCCKLGTNTDQNDVFFFTGYRREKCLKLFSVSFCMTRGCWRLNLYGVRSVRLEANGAVIVWFGVLRWN